MSYRKPNQDIISIEKKILHSHPSETLRMQSLKNLSLTGIKEEIEYAAQNDSSKAVRDFAKNLLVRYEINL
ncbi:hypothetical protein [Silvanigrella aquatica]|uniref:HEAT repeat domain-containing protein n=1 Tax=Silvanigrella aquatica TaxID=1915309 RepID=A0A1L4CY65_9BACT|nr:hypothetical protein [Silvanigrella aquatica]APJ02889.1 hypothetical protein AXG55_02710 [Silvanigrella aquatica]